MGIIKGIMKLESGEAYLAVEDQTKDLEPVDRLFWTMATLLAAAKMSISTYYRGPRCLSE